MASAGERAGNKLPHSRIIFGHKHAQISGGCWFHGAGKNVLKDPQLIIDGSLYPQPPDRAGALKKRKAGAGPLQAVAPLTEWSIPAPRCRAHSWPQPLK